MKNNVKSRKVFLCILDGWGVGEECLNSNAIHLAKTPNYNKMLRNYPNTLLLASENEVGLPKKQFGNSEVGHMNIGAGRIMDQDLLRINKSIFSGELKKNKKLQSLKNNCKKIHIVGLISEGGVHGHIDHLIEIIKILSSDSNQIFIHCITDGRDAGPTDGIKQIKRLMQIIENKKNTHISSITGRYYTMDRDNRWDRTELAYRAIVEGKGKKKFTDPSDLIRKSYKSFLTDEFLQPSNHENYKGIEHGDGFVITNFRTDRVRQFLTSLFDEDFVSFERENIVNCSKKLGFVKYSKRLEKSLDTVFESSTISNTLGKIISENGFNQLRIAETEKYAHVTYFFNGGAEDKYLREDRIVIPSPRVKTYDIIPQMSCYELTKKVVKNIKKNYYEFILLNFANPDMVGHTGNIKATIEAVEAVDECLGKVYESCQEFDYNLLVTADHGNADLMFDKENNSICTTHSLNPVPFIICSKHKIKLCNGILADIAPTILEIMEIPKPKEMTGQSRIIYEN